MQLNCIIHILFNSKTPYFLINDHEIDKNHDIQAKSDNKKLEKKCVKKIVIFCQLGFSSKIKVPQLGSARLGSARLGTFMARLGSSQKTPARAHYYYFYTYHSELLNLWPIIEVSDTEKK